MSVFGEVSQALSSIGHTEKFYARSDAGAPLCFDPQIGEHAAAKKEPDPALAAEIASHLDQLASVIVEEHDLAGDVLAWGMEHSYGWRLQARR